MTRAHGVIAALQGGGRLGDGWPNGRPGRATRIPLGQKRMRKDGRWHGSRGGRATESPAPAEAIANLILAIRRWRQLLSLRKSIPRSSLHGSSASSRRFAALRPS